MYTKFIEQLDISNPTARTPMVELWRAWQRANGDKARLALRRDFEAAIRSQFPVGKVGPLLYVGGVALPGKTVRKRWVVTDGFLKLAIDRERGLREAELAAAE